MAGDRAPPAFPAKAAGNPFANQLREVFGKVRQRMQPAGLQGGQARAPGARWQALADNAPVGAVGAPGGIQQPGRQPTPQDGLSALLTSGAMVPGLARQAMDRVYNGAAITSSTQAPTQQPAWPATLGSTQRGPGPIPRPAGRRAPRS